MGDIAVLRENYAWHWFWLLAGCYTAYTNQVAVIFKSSLFMDNYVG